MLESDALAAVCPIFRDAERVIADPVVRNRGTVGGSLCQADPAEDLTTVCTVLDAVCLVRGPAGEREVPIDDFLEGPYETSLAHNEILVEIRIPVRHNTSSAYAKVERRVGDWAVTAAGAAVTLDGDTIGAARVGLTAVNADAAGLCGPGDLAGRPTGHRGDLRRRRQARRGGLRTGHRHAGQRRIQAAPGLRTDETNPARRGRAGARHFTRRALSMQVNMTVNGESVTADVEPRTLFVHFLRDQLRLTGTHWGCDTSNCGTCVVDMDGEPVKSCTVLAAMAGGHRIRTVEGLEVDGTARPVQEGFMKCHGLQCGFCTPGMMITAKRAARPEPGSHRRRDTRGHFGPDLPLHRLHDDRAVHSVGGPTSPRA